MIDSLISWYKCYGTAKVFFGHKLSHIFGGMLIGLAVSHYCPFIAVCVVLVVAVGKEVRDYIALKSDPTNPVNALIYHVYDIIVTVLGGLGGALIFMLHLAMIPKIFVIMGIILIIAIALGMAYGDSR